MTRATKLFDLIVIGSGSAGVSAAEAAREAGAQDVAVVETRERLGGECPNRACVPTKALLRSVEVLSLARRAEEFGLKIPKVDFDFKAMMARKRRIVDTLTGGGRIENLLQQLGVALVRGNAAFVARDEIEVDGRRYKARRFIVATGSEATVPPVDGLAEAGYMTSDDLVEMQKLPKSAVIIGGGPVGCESAQILASLDVDVTIVEFTPHLLPREDEDIAKIVAESFAEQGIKALTGTKVVAARRQNGIFSVEIAPAAGGTGRKIEAEALMVAAGKRPALAALSVDRAGIDLDKRGAPILNEFLQSTNEAVYFAGDAAGQMLFTHVAHEQGEIAAQNAVKGNHRASDLSVVPRGTFCTPEVGSVGLTEKEARDKGLDVGVGKVPYAYFGKALVTDELRGLIKIVVDKKTKRILGGHIVGQAAAELVHEVALAMAAKIPYTTIAEMIHAYPTFAEGIGAAAYAVE